MSLSEILFLAVLGLVVFGPKKLAELGQHVGRALAAFRKATDEFKSQLGNEKRTTPLCSPETKSLPRRGLLGSPLQTSTKPSESTRKAAPSRLVQSDHADLSSIVSNIDQTRQLRISYPASSFPKSRPQMDKIRAQAWVAGYESAMLEFDPKKLSDRISVAEKTIDDRLFELRNDSDHHEERRLILDAQRALRVLRSSELRDR